jgi:GAF domain-containing protein
LYDKQRQQLAELRSLAQISEAVTSPQYLDDILDVVTEMAAQAMQAAVCAIFLLDESGKPGAAVGQAGQQPLPGPAAAAVG